MLVQCSELDSSYAPLVGLFRVDIHGGNLLRVYADALLETAQHRLTLGACCEDTGIADEFGRMFHVEHSRHSAPSSMHSIRALRSACLTVPEVLSGEQPNGSLLVECSTWNIRANFTTLSPNFRSSRQDVI